MSLYYVTFNNWVINYFSQSVPQFGVLRAQSSVYLTGDSSLGTFPSFASVGARASYFDPLTVLSLTISGTGTAYFTFHVTGTSSQTPGQSGRPQLQLVPVVNGQLDYAHQSAFLFDANGDALVPVAFVFGSPTTFQVDFYALAQIFTWQAGASALADYSHTLVLTGIAVTDSTGAPVTDFTIQSASGTTYVATGVLGQLVFDLMRSTGALNASHGIRNSLEVTLEAVQSALASGSGREHAACGSLGAYISEVTALSGNQIPGAEANALVDAAATVLGALHCR